jgi:molybdopterin-guanine dinucleotide biosynthesis protein A
MGRDKSMLEYYGLPQRYYLYSMLSELCDKVFLSCNEKQAAGIPENYNVLIDNEQYANAGPITGLLSAASKYPEVAFLVLACDYPFVRKDDLQILIRKRDNEHLAVSYFNPETGYREPLIGLYEKDCFAEMRLKFEAGKQSLHYFLIEIGAKAVLSRSQEMITSIDTPEAYEKAVASLKSK